MENSDLLAGFLGEAQADLSALHRGLHELRREAPGPDDRLRLAGLGLLAHRLRGSAGLYGFPQLARIAGLLERILDSQPVLDGSARSDFLNVLDTAAQVLAGGLAAAVRGAPEPDLGQAFTRLGGAQELRALLRAQPRAFTSRALSVPGDVPLPGEPSDDPAPLTRTLRSFRTEQAEVWEYFEPEIREHLSSLRAQLQQEPADLDVLFRAAHTIKGSALMVGLLPLGEFVHRMEDVLAAVRDGLIRLDTPVREELGRAADTVDALLAAAQSPPGAGSMPELQLNMDARAIRLAALAGGAASLAEPAATSRVAQPGPPPAESATIRVPAHQLEALLDQLAGLVTSRARAAQVLARLDEVQQAMHVSQRRFQATVRDFEERHLNPDMLLGTPGTEARAGLELDEQLGDLELDRYTDLNILARSIAELSADFAELRRRLSTSLGDLHDEHEALGKQLRRLRGDLTRTGRVPFAQVSARLRRWARGHSDQLDLVIEGDDLKVDSATLQRLGEPLLHLLTNALHHGLDDASERRAAGKPPRGRIELRARQDGAFLDVTVQDDGRGLDLGAIRERALARGLRSAQELRELGDDEVARLILLPGLSTAEALSTTAGRGVGMDVVATATRQLGGELLIRSVPGQGAAFTLRLPTSRRVMDILQVGVGGFRLAFAVGAVRALRELPVSELHAGPSGPEVPFEGRRVPVVDLRDLWGVPAAGDRCALVILSTLSGEVASRVDSFGLIEESAVTPPSPLLGALSYLSGTALASDGDLLPLLDPQGLQRLARRPDTWLTPAGRHEAERPRRLLLVDDSLSVRRVVGRLLERAGFEVETASDGQDALERLQLDAGYDAVVSDLEMPRLNGFELLAALRSRPATAALPVVMMTTRAGEKHQRLAFGLGATDYFTKPVNEALLLRCLTGLAGAPA